MILIASARPGWAAATPTSTTLSVDSGSSAVTTVKSGTVVTLVATVKAGSAELKVGQVEFCDATAKYCTDTHLLGTVQLTQAGTAVLKFRPGIGNHSYKAVFRGTNLDATSASAVSALTVTGVPGPFATATTIAETGDWGKYSVSATVTEVGGATGLGGVVSFLDSSNGNAVLGKGQLGAAATGLSWTSSSSPFTGSEDNAVGVGDLNGDGVPDLVIAGFNGNSSLGVLLGNGDGTFRQTTNPAITFTVGGIAIGDFNQDGIPDLAVADTYDNQVAILLGHGDGTFTADASSPATGVNPAGIAVGDYNDDGIPDLAVVNANNDQNGTITILLGKGNGTFVAVPKSAAAGSSANSIVAGDFNGDGKTDLAIMDQYDVTMTILLGNGDGTFTATASPQVSGFCNSIALADFNGDGKQDFAVGCSNGGLVEVFLGNGNGTFTLGPTFPTESIQPGALAVGDFNGDGVPDIAVLNSSDSGGVVTFLGRGDGTFDSNPVNPPGATYPSGVLAAGDFNGDGRTDLATANNALSYAGEVATYLAEPMETATAVAAISLVGVGQHLVDAKYGGIGVYIPSVSATTPLWGELPATTTTLTVAYGTTPVTSVTPNTVITLTATVAVGTAPVSAGQVKFCDGPANLCTDIHLLETAVLGNSGKATFKFVPGPGVHSFQAVFVEGGSGLTSSSSASELTVGPAKSPVYYDATAIAESGLPGDYSLTATVVGTGGSAPPTGTVSFLDASFGKKTLATAQLGPSTAGIGWLISQTPAAGSNLISEVEGDFNGDGLPDLAILWSANTDGETSPSVTILFGKGGGAFVASSTTLVTGAQSSPVMIAGDFNGDGKLDLAVLSSVGGTASYISTLLGNGNGSFTVSPASLVLSQGNVGGDGVPGFMTAADFNGDGKLDLAVVGEGVSTGGVTILLGKGDGTFKPGVNIDPDGDCGLIATGDFNGDGIPDLIATNYFNYGASPTIFLGKGDGTFTWSPASFTLDYFPTSLVVGDFTGNGVLDLAISDLTGIKIALGKGDGTFAETAASPISNSYELESMVAGDFNHDGKLDLAGIGDGNDQIVVLIGAGDGTFAASVTTPNVSQSGPGPFAIVAGDFNGDGVPDLAMLTAEINTASILLTQPTETATATVSGIAPIGAGTHNVEASYAGDTHYRAEVSSTVALTAGLEPVVISPAGGTYTTAQTITLSEGIPGATIYFAAYGVVNTNGFVPYTGPIQINEGGYETIQYYATETGYQGTETQYANFTMNLPDAPSPTFSLAPGNYAGAQTVTITDSVPGAAIYYTTNGSYPSTASMPYKGPVTVSSSETLVATAIAEGYSLSLPASAQYNITTSVTPFIYTVAGSGSYGYSGDGGPATTADLNEPEGTAVDKSGNIYIADPENHRVRKVTAATGVITTVAGNGTAGYRGDKGAATAAELYSPVSVALDSTGDLYIADSGNSVIRKVAAATGVITTIAGNGVYGYRGDGGPATAAEFSYPQSIAIDSAGNIYVADEYNEVIRKVSASTGTISTVAGSPSANGPRGDKGDGGPATSATLNNPTGVAVDLKGNLYIADDSNYVIRKVTASTGIITTVAGTPIEGYLGDGGPATSAELDQPWAVAVDNAGNFYIDDRYNGAIRKVTVSTGIITTVAGNGPYCYPISGDGGAATSAGLCFPNSVSVDQAGNLYISDDNNRVRKVVIAGAVPSKLTATPVFSEPTGTHPTPQIITITDATPGAAIYITMDGTAPTPLSAGYSGPISITGTVTVKAIAIAPGYLASEAAVATYTITAPPAGVIETVAGDGVFGYSGDGGAATKADVGRPSAVAVDSAGNLFIVDTSVGVIREVAAATGDISTVAGTGTPGYSGDGGLATAAELNDPSGIAVDSQGNLYIADTFNSVIRKVTAATGLISTVAGEGQRCGYAGDGGPATSALICYPQGLAFDKAGNLFIADTNNSLIREISAKTQSISTVAGIATPGNGYSYNSGFSGDGGLATKALLSYPTAVAVDAAGNLYIADENNFRVRKVTASTGIITTIAGNGNYGSTGNNGVATYAELSALGVAVDSVGNVYIGGQFSQVRMVSAVNGFLYAVAGNGIFGYSGDGSSATVAELNEPSGVAIGGSGNLYIADFGNSRVREVTFNPAATPVFSVAAGTYTASQSVKISDAPNSSVIYFTTDGTTPTTASTRYTEAITVSATETIKAVAISPGYAPSAVASAKYTIQ